MAENDATPTADTSQGADAPAAAGMPPPTQDAGSELQEMRTIESFDWFNKNVLSSLGQALVIVAMSAVAFSGGSAAWTAAASASVFAFELGRAAWQNHTDLKRELKLYHKDIARVLGKSPDAELTIADMRDAADKKKVGDKALKPLAMELKHLKFRGGYNLVISGLRAALTTGLAVAMSHAGQQANIEWGKVLAGDLHRVYQPLGTPLMLIGMGTMALENFGKNYFHAHEPPSAYTDLLHLRDMARHQEIQPEQVFSVVVTLDKELAKDIESRAGRPYSKLTHRNKLRFMKASEKTAHAQALAQGINDGELPVTAVALSAFKQMDWPQTAPVAVEEKAQEPAPSLAFSPAQTREAAVKSFVLALNNERNSGVLAWVSR